MIACEYYSNGICKLATQLVNIKCTTTESACNYCLNCDKPKQLNKAVASNAVGILLTIGKFNEQDELHVQLKQILTVAKLADGPGTELKKLISWFIWIRDVGDCRSCYDREQQMNQWGPEECRKNISTIIEWLRESAMKHSMPFSETLVRILINKAIRNSEKHYEMVRSSNNSST